MTIATKSKTRPHARLKLAGATAAAALAIAQDQIKPTAADIRTQVMAARASAILEQYLALSAGQMPEHPINPERNTFADLKELFYKIQPASNAIHYAVEAEQMQLCDLLDAAHAAGVEPDHEWQRRADLVLAALAAAQGHLRAAVQALVPLLQMGKAGMI
ncbi:hypothetical protein [Dechloromonas sp. H13]|uniref:hypothetical protein n=1 Tax=Dechloromonas sp. H13 TaxID=2570193 RepID=UPI001291D7D9|nr:hypothetical protein [Dechloromonas sp. H13]